jgi:histidinol dehydrogenase
MMTVLKIIDSRSRSGRRLLARLDSRGESLFDKRLLSKVEHIITDIRRGGDRALLKAVRKLDGVPAPTAKSLRLSTEIAPEEGLPPGFEEALERAIVAVERYHREQRHVGFCIEEGGVTRQERRQSLQRVGVYVPGGRAAYPSTAVMTVIPAQVAGVQEIAVATPPLAWQRNPALRFTLERLGITEVWGMGGAQAIAALAYGTESLPRVDKIVGPGNAWVTAAKKLVMGDVAIDSLAGPSEVVLAATEGVDPILVAADLLAQAEHDPQALSLLVTNSKKLAKAVAKEVLQQLRSLSTAEVAQAALKNQGAAVIVHTTTEALEWIDTIAPEHLQLLGEAESLVDDVKNAGAIFVGESTPVVFGDYLAGPSHVLPTAGSARYASALGVDDFVRRSHVVRYSRGAAARSAAAAATLADVEGLPAHAAAARLRKGRED